MKTVSNSLDVAIPKGFLADDPRLPDPLEVNETHHSIYIAAERETDFPGDVLGVTISKSDVNISFLSFRIIFF